MHNHAYYNEDVLYYFYLKNMFEKDAQKTIGKEVETVIGPSVRVEGNFTGEGNIVIEGSISGTLKTQHNLRVGKDAKVKADVQAANVYIAGEVRGNMKVTERTEILSTAKIFGNVETKILSVETGAIVQGKITMIAENREPQIEKRPNK